jgi:hypothetical protein
LNVAISTTKERDISKKKKKKKKKNTFNTFITVLTIIINGIEFSSGTGSCSSGSTRRRTSVIHNKDNGWMDGWMDGWIDGWMDGWMDENKKKQRQKAKKQKKKILYPDKEKIDRLE